MYVLVSVPVFAMFHVFMCCECMCSSVVLLLMCMHIRCLVSAGCCVCMCLSVNLSLYVLCVSIDVFAFASG